MSSILNKPSLLASSCAFEKSMAAMYSGCLCSRLTDVVVKGRRSCQLWNALTYNHTVIYAYFKDYMIISK